MPKSLLHFPWIGLSKCYLNHIRLETINRGELETEQGKNNASQDGNNKEKIKQPQQKLPGSQDRRARWASQAGNNYAETPPPLFPQAASGVATDGSYLEFDFNNGLILQTNEISWIKCF